jgi:hypothetical protein
MEMSDEPSLLHIQTGLFAALVGVLSAKGAASRQEFAEAMDVLARHEQDVRIANYFQMLGDELRGPATAAGRPFLKLVVGGPDGDRPSIPA